MFSLSLPSTIKFQMPDYNGDVESIGGWVSGEASTAYKNTRSLLDPVLKAPAALEQGAVSYIKGGATALYSSVADSISGAASAIGSTISTPWMALTSGLKWGVGIVIVGAAIYALAVLSPFIPKPGGK